MHKNIYVLVCVLFSLQLAAQNSAELKGKVTDSLTGEALIGANVILLSNNTMITGTTTDLEGEYYLSGIAAGTYVIRISYTGFGTQQHVIRLKAGEMNYASYKLGISAILAGDDIIIDGRKNDTILEMKPLDNIHIIDKTQLGLTPSRNINDIISYQPSATPTRNGLSVKGARPSATAYYLGTMPMISRLNISPRSMAQLGLVIGGVAPEYGDFTGGAVVQYLTPVETKPYATAEVISSSLFDKYHYTRFDLNFGGPLIMKENKQAGYKRMVLGYHSNFNLFWQADPSPSAIGIWKVKDDKLKELEENPIRPSVTGNGFVPAAEFLTLSDLERRKARQNASSSDLMWVGKLEYRPRTNLTFEGAAIVDRQHNTLAPWGNELLNANANPVQTNWAVASYLNMEHNLLATLDTASINRRKLKRLKYTISLQYQGVWSRVEDPELRDDYFRYGYVGRFDAYRAPSYQYNGNEGQSGKAIPIIQNGDTVWVKNYYELEGFQDTLIRFDRGNTSNPLLANYTEAYFRQTDQVRNFNQISGSGGGLLNGMSPIGIYSNMWNNIGALTVGSSINSGVSRSQTEQFSMNVNGEVNKGIHSVKLGFYFEQRISRAYSVNAVNLWDMMYQSANQGLVLDYANPQIHYDQNGTFSDTVSYRQVFTNEQTEFSKRIRQRLMEQGYRDVYGNPVDENSYLNIHALDPTRFSMDLFTADELLGTGGSNQYVSYYGYDYLGRKDRKTHSVEDFLNDPANRSIGAYRPIYAAMYLQDMIELRQMIIRFGVRVERFDANIPVLKDPYSLYPIRTAGEVKELNGNAVSHPDGVGNGYKVYVNDSKNPSQILGYRDGNQWFNAQGLRIADPTQIATKTKSGTIQPYLVDGQNEVLSAASFRDYDAKMVVLPRFSVNFPISSTASFFAYYDVLAQRPSNIFTPIDDYYFMRYNSTRVVNNPDLKQQLTTDYELGFKQSLSRSSILSITASYREQRNMIQLVRYYLAYPVSYLSYGNIDMSTVKGIRTEYSLRSGHLYLDASYQFQIAEGTGSGTGSQATLVSAGQPNLRNLFPLDFDVRHSIKLNLQYVFGNGKEYSGPVIAGARVLENAGVSMLMAAFSGQPYTANQIATPDAQNGIASRSPISGTPNGSRMPWQLNNNLNFYRAFPVVWGVRDGKPINGQITMTLWVENFLNVRNIQAVHSYSGSGETDGYLNSPNGQAATASATNAQSFIDLYNTALANPGYYGLPRRTRLSLLLTF